MYLCNRNISTRNENLTDSLKLYGSSPRGLNCAASLPRPLPRSETRPVLKMLCYCRLADGGPGIIQMRGLCYVLIFTVVMIDSFQFHIHMSSVF